MLCEEPPRGARDAQREDRRELTDDGEGGPGAAARAARQPTARRSGGPGLHARRRVPRVDDDARMIDDELVVDRRVVRHDDDGVGALQLLGA